GDGCGSGAPDVRSADIETDQSPLLQAAAKQYAVTARPVQGQSCDSNPADARTYPTRRTHSTWRCPAVACQVPALRLLFSSLLSRAELPPGMEQRSEEHTSELQSRENLVC